jgi:membrane fusion protein, multidrug efflux system
MKSTFYYFLASVVVFSCTDRTKVPSAAPPPSSQGGSGLSVDGISMTPRFLEYTIEATGNLIPYEQVQIRAERAGKMVSLSFEESSFVPAGKVLATIDDAELKAQKNRLEVNLDLAKKEVSRGLELLAIQGISQEEVDRLHNRVADLEAEIRILQIQIEKSVIIAPFSGLIGLRQISQGAYITPNDIIAELRQINPIKLEFDVPEKFLKQVKIGQVLNFTTVGQDQNFQATVYAIATEIAPGTRTFKVRAKATNGNNELLPGQFAKVTLVTGTNPKGILVPTDAIIPILNGKQVFVAKDGVAKAVQVVTGDRIGSDVEVIEGLNIGDVVITSALLTITDGVSVNVRNQ